MTANDKDEWLLQLKRSNEELDEFAYIVAHDLKEPLRSIGNYAKCLEEDFAEALGEEGAIYTDALQRLSEKMTTLLSDLLYLSRVGRSELAYKETSILGILNDIKDSLSMMLEENHVDWIVKTDLPTIYCDGTRMTEVFRNLIVNAIKYNDQSTKVIEIGHEKSDAKARERGAGDVVFYVRDNGIGIEEKHLDDVFKIFKRLHGRDEYGGGTGSGLTLAKKLVERHGGKMWVDSKIGEGSTFKFFIKEGAYVDNE